MDSSGTVDQVYTPVEVPVVVSSMAALAVEIPVVVEIPVEVDMCIQVEVGILNVGQKVKTAH